MDISDIKKSISGMSDEELMVLVKETRANRRVVKRNVDTKPRSTQTKSRNPKANVSGVSVDDLINQLGADQLLALLSKAKGGDNGTKDN